MKRVVAFLFLSILPLSAQETKIAVVGLVHSHVWRHLETMIGGEPARLVGIAESNPELVAEAAKLGASEDLFASDY